ncbi:transglycosylase SLT domain-containing protein [uncultured Cohaesibacter sp.]|uniref:transglycosylase SLT domain-containing protein n=1 Tax=uncultured Cohaesibacter sp. TaxID=1002546 RepID=UPI0029C6F027|nr:transglycosylase SLT domain-containing protein [uncultured Cohaesibacter sp.]
MANSVSFNNSIRFQAAFEEASRTTGTDFEFLLNTAQRESNFNASAKAPTSSASGLFQFVEQTWLETMKESGPELGYGNVAAQISQSGDKYYVRDPEVRQQILDMRNDPKVSALMAGAYAQSNREQLAQELDRSPTQGELYAAHFLGAQGSSKLITLAENEPNVTAANIFPAQAQANKNIFYDRNGQAKSVSEVYDDLVSTASTEPASSKKKGLLDMLGLGNLFSAKDSTKSLQLTRSSETSAVQAQQVVQVHEAGADTSVVSDSRSSLEAFFSQPLERTLPSRYGLSYLPDNSVSSEVRASRYVTGDNGERSVDEASAHTGVIASRIYSQATGATEQSGTPSAETAGSSVPLPRSKPSVADVSTTADVYVNELNGMLPRAKPVAAMASGQSEAASPHRNPLDLTQSPTSTSRQQQRLGAMDLSAFLKGDVFTSSDKG